MSRDRSSVGGGSRKLNDLDPGRDEPPPAISSADLDQLMADFDLNDPLDGTVGGAAAAAPATSMAGGTAAAPAAGTAANGKPADKPAGLAGALPGGLGAGLSSLPNPLGDSNVMGKLGDLATKNPVADVMSSGKSFLFKKFGL